MMKNNYPEIDEKQIRENLNRFFKKYKITKELDYTDIKKAGWEKWDFYCSKSIDHTYFFFSKENNKVYLLSSFHKSQVYKDNFDNKWVGIKQKEKLYSEGTNSYLITLIGFNSYLKQSVYKNNQILKI